jgi:hypothetical protein
VSPREADGVVETAAQYREHTTGYIRSTVEVIQKFIQQPAVLTSERDLFLATFNILTFAEKTDGRV